MTEKKFETEIDTLKKFYEYYCKDKHDNLKKNVVKFSYNNKNYNMQLLLCDECINNIKYSFERLQECKHEIKPRCRNCSQPCYDKTHWKNTAKVMKYSAIRLGLSSIKQKVKNIFK
ncbi:hypothetical protein CPU12_08175 [Malaciobacter molluscorum LMG 25693]|uniref:Nitrous oxide-regulated protein n=1 Tax=Malaciobacter molluscorum LMG 25693 TaxID=870501 RepID=A0A2G1DHC5_9BACT|nr:nitrous oxide-stimulated promoter family protein [Malaciobacter molluscorum]AXX93688.1 putative nitrous oxide-regulated protein [Malaciobacter molluscorum LMG 25693]PHO17902.1 hypothetical protein CPU12_08175 [Malaciobacter molluscorum LMG 25693]